MRWSFHHWLLIDDLLIEKKLIWKISVREAIQCIFVLMNVLTLVQKLHKEQVNNEEEWQQALSVKNKMAEQNINCVQQNYIKV